MRADARRTEITEISLLKTSTLSFPRARLKIFIMEIAKALVFTPPPVEPGEAPTHIRCIWQEQKKTSGNDQRQKTDQEQLCK